MRICKQHIKFNIQDIVTDNKCELCGHKGTVTITQEIIDLITNNIILNYPYNSYYCLASNGMWIKKYPFGLINFFQQKNDYFQFDNPKHAEIFARFFFENSKIKNKEFFSSYFVEPHIGYPLKEVESKIMNKIKILLKTQNPYKLYHKYLEYFQDKALKLIPIFDNKSCDYFYRARVGCNYEKAMIDDLEKNIFSPFVKDEIMAPPPYLSNEGRFNRKGYSFTYVASDIDTAISEVRPEAGSIISVAKLKLNHKSKYLDFRSSIQDKLNLNDEISEIHFVIKLMDAFSKPVIKERRYEYLLTQFFSDIIRELGYNVIVYDSPQNKGYNLLDFNGDGLELLSGSEKLFSIEKIKYTKSPKRDERYGWDCTPYFEDDSKNEKSIEDLENGL